MKKFSLYMLLFASSYLVSCEKETGILDVSKEGSGAAVGFGETLADGLLVSALPDAGMVSDSLKVFLSGASGSADVTITEDPSAVDDYNALNGTDIPVAPNGTYSLPSSISISGHDGSGVAKFDITKLFADGFTFAIGIKITSVSGAANTSLATQNRIVYLISIKNQYDADYTTTGYLVHPSSPRGLNDVKPLTTVSAVRCEAPHSDLYPSGYYFQFDVSGDNKLVNYGVPFGAATPAPPASGFMTVDNPTGDPNYPGPPYVSSTYNNTYDPAAQTFWMHYGYGTGTSNQNQYSREVFEKWVRR
jgi:hypothetical protein